jgi:cysteine-rich repeat protein
MCISGVCEGVSGSCGNGVVDCNEQCDDGNTNDDDGCSSTCTIEEICLDQLDNDGDGLFDCVDPECPCAPLVNLCKHPCLSKLLIKKKLDREFLQTAFVPTTPINPPVETFSLLITNANGVVYSKTVPPGSFFSIGGGGWIHKNRLASKLGGLFQVKILPDSSGANPNAIRVAIKAFGEMTDPTLSLMTVQITIGNDAFFATTDWDVLKTGGWVTWLPAGIP